MLAKAENQIFADPRLNEVPIYLRMRL
jgi:hypothetical protein